MDKKYIVKVTENPEYCGVGAGGAQFANGQATITNEWLANWFRSHDGYTVEEVAQAVEQPKPEDTDGAEEKAKAPARGKK